MRLERVYWDSVCFISRIERRPDRIAVLEQMTDRAERGELEIVTSAFTLCEVGRVEGVPLPDDQERLIVDFFENEYILIQQVNRQVAEVARQILRTHANVPGKDAIHIASAQVSNSAVLYTYDERHLLRLNGQIDNPPLRIERPTWRHGQPPLPTGDAET